MRILRNTMHYCADGTQIRYDCVHRYRTGNEKGQIECSKCRRPGDLLEEYCLQMLQIQGRAGMSPRPVPCFSSMLRPFAVTPLMVPKCERLRTLTRGSRERGIC